MGKKKESKPLLVKSEKTNKSGSGSGACGERQEQQQQQHQDKSEHQQRRQSHRSEGKESGPASSGRKGKSTGSIVSSIKRGQKSKISPVHTRPKLESLHETSVEAEDHRDMSEGKCLDKNFQEQTTTNTATTTTTTTSDSPERGTGGGEGATSGSGSGEGNESLDQTKSCPIYFGVRSYLHHFYETVNQPATPGTEEDFLYLIHPKGRKCGALWFKIGLIIGATLFLLGAIAIVIGYAIPKQDAVVGRTDEFEIVDKDAVRFNKNLDICKLIGLAGFCSGGLVLVISLLAPTFTSTYWEDDPATEPFRVSLSSSLIYEAEPKSPIPVTEKIKCIQPIWSE